MHPIPRPHLLDPDRLLVNDRGDFSTSHETRADLLESALQESCAYADQLWENLDAARQYLIDSLPPDPRSPGPHPSAGASPTGPDDEQGWQKWMAAYASITSVLCGPQGDSGFGLHEARGAAQTRRTAPVLNLHARQPEVSQAEQGAESRPHVGGDSRAVVDPAPGTGSTGRGAIRSAATAMLVLLALRGLRPLRHRTS